MPDGHLVDEAVAAYFIGRPPSTVRRWAAEGRITRYPNRQRRNGVLYNIWELPAAKRDKDTMALISPATAPPVKDQRRLAA